MKEKGFFLFETLELVVQGTDFVFFLPRYTMMICETMDRITTVWIAPNLIVMHVLESDDHGNCQAIVFNNTIRQIKTNYR